MIFHFAFISWRDDPLFPACSYPLHNTLLMPFHLEFFLSFLHLIQALLILLTLAPCTMRFSACFLHFFPKWSMLDIPDHVTRLEWCCWLL
jgi:hypothetical protein